jgi:hypothetical protein
MNSKLQVLSAAIAASLVALGTVLTSSSANARHNEPGSAHVYDAPSAANPSSEYFSRGFGRDDDVDTTTNAGEPIELGMGNDGVGDTLTWTYLYQLMPQGSGPGYKVNSGDDADIDRLRLYGTTLGGAPESEVTVQFLNRAGALVGTPYNAGNHAWGANNLTISGNDLLGRLDGLEVIGGLKLTVMMTAGSVGFSNADYLWEAGDISPLCGGGGSSPSADSGGPTCVFDDEIEASQTFVPEPATPTFVLLAGLVALGVSRRRAASRTK